MSTTIQCPHCQMHFELTDTIPRKKIEYKIAYMEKHGTIYDYLERCECEIIEVLKDLLK